MLYNAFIIKLFVWLDVCGAMESGKSSLRQKNDIFINYAITMYVHPVIDVGIVYSREIALQKSKIRFLQIYQLKKFDLQQ